MNALPSQGPVEFLIQFRPHCGLRSYAIAGRPKHQCGVCGVEVGPSDEPWEIFRPDLTPLRNAYTEQEHA